MSKFIWKETFNIFGYLITFSITRSLSGQLLHLGVHFLIALGSPILSLGWLLGTEVRDGEQGHLFDWKEGFNIWPDFVFRLAGVPLGYYAYELFIKEYAWL